MTPSESSNPIADALSTPPEEGEPPKSEAGPTPGSKEEDSGTAEPSTEEFEEFELTLSDQSPLSQEELDAIAATASEKGWSKEEAEAEIKNREDYYSKGVEAASKPMKEYIDGHKKRFNEDPDFNGDKKIQTYTAIAAAVKKFAGSDDTLLKELSSPQIGNNYYLAKFLKSIGEAVQGDMPLGTGAGPQGQGDSEHTAKMKRLYPSMFKNE